MNSGKLEGMNAVSTPQPLILTATMEPSALEVFDAQRRTFFPPERNVLTAHITLFHHLPGAELENITTQLEAISLRTPRITAEVTGLRFLGQGVAYNLRASRLSELRAELGVQWAAWLTNQDRSGFKPHVTVQNKVSGETARETLRILEARFQPWSFSITGLALWRYLGGPWEPVETFAFRT
jgi:2'-5' RNA ligase